jgi:hypothetical protein
MPCRRAGLPAYSHNDYENERPLVDAVAAGYRGVEADVFLVEGELRVGHDRRSAGWAGTLEATYIAPLAAHVARCGRLTGEREHPFLLALEIKEPSRPAYDAVVALLARHPGAFDLAGTAPHAPIRVVMVGWHPSDVPVNHQRRVSRREDTLTAGAAVLLSLDYGKTVGRPWRSAAARRRWLRTVAALERRAPDRMLRVHNVPVRRAIYLELLGAGVDLIGTKRLAATRELLSPAPPR